MRIITILSGIMLIGTGIWCFAHPGATFLSVAFIFGIAMLISGLVNIVSFLVYRKQAIHSYWQLSDGLLSLILGCIIIADLLITEPIAIIFFGMWIIFSGAMRIAASLIIKNLEITGWYWGLIFGILSLLAGVCAFVYPLVEGLAMVIIIGGVFCLQGANIMIMGIHMKKS